MPERSGGMSGAGSARFEDMRERKGGESYLLTEFRARPISPISFRWRSLGQNKRCCGASCITSDAGGLTRPLPQKWSIVQTFASCAHSKPDSARGNRGIIRGSIPPARQNVPFLPARGMELRSLRVNERPQSALTTAHRGAIARFIPSTRTASSSPEVRSGMPGAEGGPLPEPP